MLYGIGICGIDSDRFIAFAQFNLAEDTKIGARLALFPNPGPLNHFDKGFSAAVEDGQFEIVEFYDGVVDTHASEGREQVLGGGDEHALFHQAGGVADASYVTSAGLDLEAF